MTRWRWRRGVVMRRCGALAIVAFGTRPLGAQARADTLPLSVIPRPASLARAAGRFTLTPSTTIWTDGPSALVARQLARTVESATGYTLAVRAGNGTSRSGNRIVIQSDPTRRARFGLEGYRLVVRAGVITITSAAPAGAFYAVQTLLQLLPADIFRDAPVGARDWTVPAVTIDDRPRYAWRGSHLDVARHFMPKAFVKKYIDLLALHKMNVFHWHLTDDQGWRIEIKKYPRLTQVGAWRPDTTTERTQGAPGQAVSSIYGGFYTQDDIREIVAYAAARFVTIVPEIEMPGHARAAIAAYPALGNHPDTTIGVWTQWGVSDDILNPSDATIAFMQDVLSEVLTLFPGTFIHVGGDEAVKTQWRASAAVQARMRQLGLANEDALQSWFITQMATFLARHGRRLVGWDEILEGGLAPGAVVMSWRGTRGGVLGAREGHDVVMAPVAETYFDHDQAVSPMGPPGGRADLPIDTVYAFTPIPPELEPEFARHVLGGQAQLWTEYMPDPERVEYMAFPRLCAMAEALWTVPARKDYADFAARLPAHLARLRVLDVNFYAPL